MTQYSSTVGPIELVIRGHGPTVLLLHGALLDGSFWDECADLLNARGYRTVVPTLPLGSHAHPMHADARLDPPEQARVIGEIVDHVLRTEPGAGDEITVVANDTATALVQLLLVERPRGLRAAVLSNGDCYETFLPPQFAALTAAAAIPGALAVVPILLRSKFFRTMRITYGWLSAHDIGRARALRWTGGLRRRSIRRDAAKVLRGIDSAYTMRAAERFGAVDVPVHLIWGDSDRLFPLGLAERLHADLPFSTLDVLDARATYLPLDLAGRFTEALVPYLPAAAP